MPPNKDALSRYRWIDERLSNKRLPDPNLDGLIGYVSDKMGKSISRRTLQKDIQDMRYSPGLNFNAPIIFNRRSGTYRYEEDGYSISNMPVSEYDLQGLEMAIGILEQFRNVPVIRQFEEAILRIAASVRINRKRLEKKPSLIRLDTPATYKGLEWITEIVEAMKTREIIRISYQSFNRDAPTEHQVEPYHLREYQNRFYLIGKSLRKGDAKILTFALDRIVNLWPTGKHFDAQTFDDAAYFDHVLGISIPDLRPERIELSFSPQQGKYIKSQPIHHSQVVLKDNAAQLVVRLELAVNHELVMLLLSYGSAVRVIKPSSLAKRIREEALATLKQYGD